MHVDKKCFVYRPWQITSWQLTTIRVKNQTGMPLYWFCGHVTVKAGCVSTMNECSLL